MATDNRKTKQAKVDQSEKELREQRLQSNEKTGAEAEAQLARNVDMKNVVTTSRKRRK